MCRMLEDDGVVVGQYIIPLNIINYGRKRKRKAF